MGDVVLSQCRGARCGNDGCADRRALRQRRHSGAVTRCHSRRGARRTEARTRLEAGSIFRPRFSGAHHYGRIRHRPRQAQQRRLDSRSDHRTARREACAARKGGGGSTCRDRRVVEHVRHTDSIYCRGTQRRIPSPLDRDALLQPAALSPARRSHSDGRHGSRCCRSRVALRRRAPRQGRGDCERHAELHRQPHWPLRRDSGVANAREWAVHHRRDRRDHWPRTRPPEERHVPDDGYRRARCARSRRHESENAAVGRRSERVCAAADRREVDRARIRRREKRRRVLQTTEGRRRVRDPHARSGDADISCSSVAAPRHTRRGEADRTPGGADEDALPRERQRRRVPPRDPWPSPYICGPRRARRRQLHRRCGPRDAMGIWLGARAV